MTRLRHRSFYQSGAVLSGQLLTQSSMMASNSHKDLVLAQIGGSSLPLRPKKASSEETARMGPKSPKQHMNKPEKTNDTPTVQSEANGASANLADCNKTSSSIPLPDFIIKRNELFDELKRKHDVEVLGREKPVIDVVLDLGNDKNGVPRPAMPVAAKAWESTPGSFLRHVDKDISSDVVVAKVDGKELWDLDRPLERSCRVSYIPFTSSEGRNVFWHSSAHVLGEAAECQYECLLSHGPPVEQGFFYDMAIAGG